MTADLAVLTLFASLFVTAMVKDWLITSMVFGVAALTVGCQIAGVR